MSEVKTKNPARRERLNKDWALKVQTYRCWPLGDIPQDLWDTAHAMRRLWNEFAEIFKKAAEADKKDEDGKPLLSKDERRAIWAPLDTRPLREVAKGYSAELDSYCREEVVVRFMRTVAMWRKNPKLYGAPRFQRASEMVRVRIPINFNFGISASAITGGKTSTVGATYTLPFKREAPEMYLNNGHFCVGVKRARLNLHVAYGGRSGKKKYFLPEDCRIKQASLCGRKDSAFGWSWSLQFRLEHPPSTTSALTGRVCGWDSGWRLMGDYVRIGVIADNAGHFYELTVPLAPASLNRRQRRERAHCEKNGWMYDKPETWRDLMELDSRAGNALQACKTRLLEIYEEEREAWPEEARQIMDGIVKMRDTGLRSLRRRLADFDSPATAVIDEWEAKATNLNRTIRAFQIHAGNAKRDAYRQIAAWLNNFDRIAWEGDLNLKQMAEEGGQRKERRKQEKEKTGQWPERTPDERQLEASQKFRQIAGQYELRQFVKERHAARLQNEKSAYSTQTCSECGAVIVPGRKLLLVCANRHVLDQDVNASLNFLKRIEYVANITAPPLEIPEHLRGYLRVMDASEVRLGFADSP